MAKRSVLRQKELKIWFATQVQPSLGWFWPYRRGLQQTFYRNNIFVFVYTLKLNFLTTLQVDLSPGKAKSPLPATYLQPMVKTQYRHNYLKPLCFIRNSCSTVGLVQNSNFLDGSNEAFAFASTQNP